MLMRKAALDYVNQGYLVFPIRENEKRPACRHGCLDGTNDRVVVSEWWRRKPKQNLAIHCKGLVVIDRDVGHNWPNDEQEADLLSAPTQSTPSGGQHHFFKRPDGLSVNNNAALLAPKIDIRTTGGYVLVGPSTINGIPYTWINPLPSIDCLPELPSWLASEIANMNLRSNGPHGAAARERVRVRERERERVRERVRECVGEHGSPVGEHGSPVGEHGSPVGATHGAATRERAHGAAVGAEVDVQYSGELRSAFLKSNAYVLSASIGLNRAQTKMVLDLVNLASCVPPLQGDMGEYINGSCPNDPLVMPEGGRNNFLHHTVCGHLRNQGFSLTQIYALLSTINDLVCNPPIQVDEMERMLISVAEYPPVSPPEMEALTADAETRDLVSEIALLDKKDPDLDAKLGVILENAREIRLKIGRKIADTRLWPALSDALKPLSRMRKINLIRNECDEKDSLESRRACLADLSTKVGEKIRLDIDEARGEETIMQEILSYMTKLEYPVIVLYNGTYRRVDANGLEMMNICRSRNEILRFFEPVRMAENDGNWSWQCSPLPNVYVSQLLSKKPSDTLTWPSVDRLTKHPYFDSSSNYIHKKGFYLKDGGILLSESHPAMTDIDMSIEEAKAVLDEVVCDYSFGDQAAKMAWKAAALTPLIRDMTGPSPLYIVHGPRAGLGKTMLVDIISEIYSVDQNKPVSRAVRWANSDEEMQKSILTVVNSESPVSIIKFDNVVSRNLSSFYLEEALTSRILAGRRLCTNDTIEAKNKYLWMMTVNNPDFSPNVDSGGLIRRSVMIPINPTCDNPSLRPRSDFLHPGLINWVRENRERIFNALVVYVRNWIEKGSPRGEQCLQSFDTYSSIIGGIFDAANEPGWLDRRDNAVADLDPESSDWLAVMLKLHELYPDFFTATQLAEPPFFTDVDASGLLPERLRLKLSNYPAGLSRARVIAFELRQHINAIFDNKLRLESYRYKASTRYRLTI